MAEILALGISHYPPLSRPDNQMTGILQRMLRNPALPASLRTPDGWPAPMREQWSNDEGAEAAARHRAELIGWMRRVRAELDRFNPDFVLIWGDDQYENFQEDIVPPYCIAAYDRFAFAPPPGNVWDDEKGYDLAGHPQAGRLLAASLLDAGFDTAYAYKPLHHTLGHAFTNAIYYLDYDRKGFPWPILPFAVNCYGRKVVSQRGGVPRFDGKVAPGELDPPAPSPWRLFDLGSETARILMDSPWRVALLASSGWSHAFLTAKNHYLWPDTDSDRRMYNQLASGDYASWRAYKGQAVEDCGQQEILNWMCLTGALQALERKPRETGFVDTWIFNSSKVFLIA